MSKTMQTYKDFFGRIQARWWRVRVLPLAACTALFVVAPANGQDRDADATADEEFTDKLEEIIVTGSRISREGYDAPSPVTSIGSEVIEESGLPTLGDVLLRSPVLAVGQGIANAQTSGESAGATFANLRGLGSFRTLTLINGRRRVPGSLTTSSVDLSSIPPSMVERVEIVTGGTSAVYGADAVTGVVNVILKRDFDGLALDFSAGLPDAGGGGSAQQATLHWGSSLHDGRGNFSVGASYYNSEVLQATERDFSTGQNFMFFETNIPGTDFDGVVPTFTVRRDPTTFLFSEGGTFWNWNGSTYDYYTVDPDLRFQQNDAPPFFNQFNGVLGNGWASGGDGFAFDKYGLLRGGFESINALINFDYDVGDNLNFYANLDVAVSESESPFQPNFHPANGDSIFVQRDNAFLTPTTQQFMDDNGFASIFVLKTHEDLGVRTTFVDRTNYTVSSGLRGTFLNGWDFDGFAQFGRMEIDTKTGNTLRRANYLNAIDSVIDPGSGQPVCRSAAAQADGCVPLMAFGRNTDLTQQQRDYVLHDKVTDLDLEQTLLGFQITGDAVELPAGMIGFAAGLEYRDESLSFQDDPLNLAGELLLNSPTEAIDGGFDVFEAYTEVIVPLLADKPGAKLLQVEGAYRYSDYSHIGSTKTWKLGASWNPVDDVRFRYTRSFSVRAPTLTDIFSPGIASFAFITDPCDATIIGLLTDPAQAQRRTTNCAALGLPAGYVDPSPTVTKEVITGGNPDLEPEDSTSWTAGIIFTPGFAEGLRLSLDFWDIDLSEAISALGVGEILNNCVDFATINNEFCPLVTRDPVSGEITSISNVAINIDQQTAKGVDLQANYNFDPGWAPGSFQLYLGVTLLDELNFIDIAPGGNTISEEANEVQGTPLPEWRGNVSIAYDQGPLRVSWFGNYIGSMTIDNAAAEGTYQPGFESIESVFYHYLYADYDFNESVTIRAGVNNLLDEDPPANPFSFLGAGGLYDNNGRYFWAGATVRF